MEDSNAESDVPEGPRIDKARILELFNELDKNQDGKIDAQEIRERLLEQGIDPNIAEVLK